MLKRINLKKIRDQPLFFIGGEVGGNARFFLILPQPSIMYNAYNAFASCLLFFHRVEAI